MTVVEVRGRGGQLIERLRFSQATIRIGRAFDNDVILEDEHASPHHLRLSLLDGDWRFEDLDSLNGLRHRGRPSAGGVLHSGDELRIGHTSLQIYAADHRVSPAAQLDGAEARLASLGRHAVWSSLIAASMTVAAVTLFWDTAEEFEPLTALGPVFGEVLAVFAVAAFWALIGRVLRHRAYFFAHLSLWLALGLVGVLTTFTAQWLAYNANSQLLEEVMETGLSTAVLAFAVWGSLTLATNLPSQRRFSGALGVGFAISALSVAGELQFDREFSSRPDYYGRVEGPSLLLVRPAPEAGLLDELPALFDRADVEAEEDEAAESRPSS